eukprot:TRINITY_DN32758_c0_g1_i1.p1 TRINITY_DN32758_c0_g1~~TRINITY_DN32758_c0_g1_i1.p1  ORF type:complete len:218 (+),score=44.20 TRINITY_DN32758_c0_g1_i1:69-722(+)
MMELARSLLSALQAEPDAGSGDRKPELKALGFSWKNSLATVKNTFIHFDLHDSWASQGSRRRCNSSPAVLAKIAVQAEARSAAKGEQDLVEKLGVAEKHMSWADGSTDAEGSLDFSTSSGEFSSQAKAEKILVHENRTCRPCSYFHLKKDGCRQGEDCEYCHFCSLDDVKSKKRMVKREVRTEKRAAASAARKEAREAAKLAKGLPGKRSKRPELVA